MSSSFFSLTLLIYLSLLSRTLGYDETRSAPVFSSSYASLSSTHKETRQTPCVPYNLTNECSYVVGSNVLELLDQQTIFDVFLATNISNVRMVPKDCRRSLIWFACNTAFPSCPESPSAQDMYTICLDVQASCQPYGINITCSAPPSSSTSTSRSLARSPSPTPSPFSPSPSPTPSYFVSSFENTTQYPIPTTTCLSNTSEPIPCCPSPFVLGAESECVVKCYQFEFEPDREQGWMIAAFVLVWVGTVCTIISLIPIFSITPWNHYPNYLIIKVIFPVLFAQHIMMWSMYAGGATNWLCGGDSNGDLTVCMQKFLNSPTCVMQAVLIAFFFLSMAFWQTLLSLNLCSQILCERFVGSRFVFILEFFHPRTVTKRKEYLFSIICWGIPFCLSLSLLIYGFKNETQFVKQDLYFYISPGQLMCMPTHQLGHAGFYILYIPIVVLDFIAFSTMTLTILTILRRNRKLIYFQWRSIFFSFYLIFLFIIIEILVYYIVELWPFIQNTVDYATCVAGHPQDADPPCTRQYFGYFWYFCIFEIIVYSWLVFVSTIVYLTSSFVQEYWTIVFFQKRLPTQSDWGSSIGVTSSRRTFTKDTVSKFDANSYQPEADDSGSTSSL